MTDEALKSVAILLATHNSAEYIEHQIVSLRENKTPFTLHWLDDHSRDNTRELVRTLALQLDVQLQPWHQPGRLGVPGAFFRLMECACADMYLFCDHDDIWQPGKIDATVSDLIPDIIRPTLCYSEPLVFYEEKREELHRYFELIQVPAEDAQMISRAFLINPAVGNTVGFTRPLRDIFLAHKEIAETHAIMHDWWMQLLALASGVSRLLRDVPTTLYRQHGGNTVGVGFGARRSLGLIWQKQQQHRIRLARQAAGFVQAADHMIPGNFMKQLIADARLIQVLERRQSPLQIATLLRRRIMPVPWRRAMLLATVSMLSDATN